MSEGLNKVVFLGNLTNDVEIKFTQSNQAVLTVRIAATESFFDQNSKERKERTEFMNAVIWGKRAEALAKILHKGSKIAVDGRLQTRSWEDKQGNKRYTTEIVAQNVILLDGKRRDDAADSGGSYQGSFGGGGTDVSDDIPFRRFDIPL